MNEIVIAAAGGGKTTRIVERALAAKSSHCAMLTYTLNNVREIEKSIYKLNAAVPSHIEVWSWYSFLLRELARPYQRSIGAGRIDGIHWVQGRSARFTNHSDIAKYYFLDKRLIYSDKLTRFICECNKATTGAVIQRLEQRFDSLYIDEIQDMAGYDIDLIELILRSRIKVTLVGDHRQATFRTNNAPKNRAYLGVNMINKLKEWDRANLAALSYEQETYRCHQEIADLADAFFPKEPRTISRNHARTGHDGVFAIPTNAVKDYMDQYRPQVLRLDKRTPCGGYEAMNFGESKGLTFTRVLIFPHKKGKDWLLSGNLTHVLDSAAKMYVGITRARHSVALVVDGNVRVPGIKKFPAYMHHR